MQSEMNGDWFHPDETTFGDRLAGARENTGMSQAEFAQRLGVRSETVEDWENDISEPRGNRVSMMAGVLNVSIRWLITGQGEGPSDLVDETDTMMILNEIREVRTQIITSLDRLTRLEKMLGKQENAGD